MEREFSPSIIASLVGYEPDIGLLFWKHRGSEHFVGTSKGGPDIRAAAWNTRYAEREAFTAIDRYGYKVGKIFNRHFSAHRVALAVTLGEWPDQVDHINGIRSDNRLENLRAVSHSENGKNQGLQPSNTSGFSGVLWRPSARRWISEIRADGKRHYLGSFIEKSDAIAARKEAEVRFGFHQNHGKLVRAARA